MQRVGQGRRALQGLGYVGESFELGESETRAFDFWAAELELVTQHLTGEMSFHLLKDDPDSASAILAESRLHDAKLPRSLLQRSRGFLTSIEQVISDEVVPASARELVESEWQRELSRGEVAN